jgi:hypothetical protein
MTKEELEKLTKLKRDIEDLQKIIDVSKRHKPSIKYPGYDQYLSVPFDKVPGLEEQVIYLLNDMIYERLEELENKFNYLTLCNQVTGGPTYTPANLE